MWQQHIPEFVKNIGGQEGWITSPIESTRALSEGSGEAKLSFMEIMSGGQNQNRS